MAKYTETFAEYLQGGGAIPSTFSLIQGFGDLFTQHYCDKEIGFETETLFAIKLDLTAKIVMPLYQQRLSKLATALLGMGTPNKTYYTHVEGSQTNGEQRQRAYALPINENLEGVEPSGVSVNEQSINGNTTDENRRETGLNLSEQFALIDKLNEQVQPLMYKLLEEFKSLFMEVY